MRENHPYFDRPLFLIGRASRLREFCKKVPIFGPSFDDLPFRFLEIKKVCFWLFL